MLALPDLLNAVNFSCPLPDQFFCVRSLSVLSDELGARVPIAEADASAAEAQTKGKGRKKSKASAVDKKMDASPPASPPASPRRESVAPGSPGKGGKKGRKQSTAGRVWKT